MNEKGLNRVAYTIQRYEMELLQNYKSLYIRIVILAKVKNYFKQKFKKEKSHMYKIFLNGVMNNPNHLLAEVFMKGRKQIINEE